MNDASRRLVQRQLDMVQQGCGAMHSRMTNGQTISTTDLASLAQWIGMLAHSIAIMAQADKPEGESETAGERDSGRGIMTPAQKQVAIAKSIKQRWGLKLFPSYGAIALHLLRMRQAEQVAQLPGEVGYLYRLAGAGRELARQEYSQNAQKAPSAGAQPTERARSVNG